MSIDELNRRVTNAIIRAERLPAGSRDAQDAFREVSALEESIAELVPADDIEGEIARLGAVTAALSAGEPLRAVQLADRFLVEALAPAVAAKLRQLVAEADAELARAASDVHTAAHA
jgi:hypothetical protein